MDYVKYSPISSKLLALFTANTKRNPSPVRMYWSLIAEYSSWPAVSKMSSKHVSPSVISIKTIYYLSQK